MGTSASFCETLLVTGLLLECLAPIQWNLLTMILSIILHRKEVSETGQCELESFTFPVLGMVSLFLLSLC